MGDEVLVEVDFGEENSGVINRVGILKNRGYFCEKVYAMIISIKIETADDLKVVEPVLALLGQSKAKISIQKNGAMDDERKKALGRLIQFINDTSFPVVTKIEIPNREERNARR